MQFRFKNPSYLLKRTPLHVHNTLSRNIIQQDCPVIAVFLGMKSQIAAGTVIPVHIMILQIQLYDYVMQHERNEERIIYLPGQETVEETIRLLKHTIRERIQEDQTPIVLYQIKYYTFESSNYHQLEL